MTNFTNLSGGGDDRTARPYRWQLPMPGVLAIHDMGAIEIEDMAENLAAFRDQARAMVQLYRCWKRGYEQEIDGFEKIHRAYDGIFVRRQFAEVWRTYLRVNHDYHDMRRVYMAKLCHPPYRRAA